MKTKAVNLVKRFFIMIKCLLQMGFKILQKINSKLAEATRGFIDNKIADVEAKLHGNQIASITSRSNPETALQTETPKIWIYISTKKAADYW